ncbi:hypothetical protein QCM80_09335 [Bradyrhizobium sp. SSUT112]|uniref:hypothetical protein n=1 Tax=Bradyrhizobium sp. SSUT112 TaxID=3040604 RepID=UPI002446DCA8|nr:hypothetical protein [Bradyrhizobium sp. SSUT112]MDH2350869.1 hypothetical protein [Bradyrhizobium sp. SSUT112]
MINDKQDCIESVTKVLERTSVWRKSLVARWPDDPRNARAAARLDQLAADATNMTDDQWTELKSYYGWASESWRDSLNQTARQVGFHHRSGALDYFIKALVQNLSVSKSIAA